MVLRCELGVAQRHLLLPVLAGGVLRLPHTLQSGTVSAQFIGRFEGSQGLQLLRRSTYARGYSDHKLGSYNQ
jgi:hypothetical protein